MLLFPIYAKNPPGLPDEDKSGGQILAIIIFWHPRRPKSAAIPKPHDLSFCFHHRRIPQLKNHVLSYTESTDFRPISEARFRVSHGTLTAYSFLYLLRATFYPAKLFWSEPPKLSFQGFGRELRLRRWDFGVRLRRELSSSTGSLTRTLSRTAERCCAVHLVFETGLLILT
jgi:hypothetical protein